MALVLMENACVNLGYMGQTARVETALQGAMDTVHAMKRLVNALAATHIPA